MREERKAQVLALAVFAAGLAGTTQACCAPVRAEDRVSPELVASVQHAMRPKRAHWSTAMATRVANAMNTAERPSEMLALAVLESDMDANGIAWHGVEKADVGLMAVRCVLYPGSSANARGLGPRSAGALTARRETAVPAGRCQVGPARGLTVQQLKNPVRNIKVAARLLVLKRKAMGADYLRAYHGSTDPNDPYAAWVEAVVLAFGGCEVKVERARVRELIRKIAAAVLRERKS